MEIRHLAIAELGRASEIDVTEDGSVVMMQSGGELSRRPETWSRPPRPVERWAEFETRWRTYIANGGAALGAFEGGRLVGIATLRRAVRPGVDQLEALFVDRRHRSRGIAAALVGEIAGLAREGGARELYVSATPSESAVGCYRSLGFVPTLEPIPELLELEPDDIHMTHDLSAERACSAAAPRLR